jgi:hypothetical protein
VTISTLIDKVDTVELVRDQIAAILKLESDSQVALAAAAGLSGDPWRLRVFVDRASPWEFFEDGPDHYQGTDDVSPVVNVWFEGDSFDRSASDLFEYQKTRARFNVDVLGYAKAEVAAAGHTPGDVLANAECSRAARLVRNILMAAEYWELGLPNVVGERWLASRTTLLIPADATDRAQRMRAMRLAFEVTFIESSPQVEGEPLEILTIRVNRTAEGELYFAEMFDFTT